MNLDIRDAIITMVVLAVLGSTLVMIAGFRTIRKGREMNYFRLRRKEIASGMWMVIMSILLLSISFLIGWLGEPLAYRYFPPSPTPTATASITLTPTISPIPSNTPIPSLTPIPLQSHTPTITTTPHLPDAVAIQFVSTVTPGGEVVFSPILFSKRMVDYQAVEPATVFENPVGSIFATFSYDGMTMGAQWTALWLRDGTVVFYETEPWQGGTGGYAFSMWGPPAEDWLPGTYQVVLFVGMEWKALGEFRVMGDPPPPTLTPSPTITRTSTKTLLPTATFHPTDTRWLIPTP